MDQDDPAFAPLSADEINLSGSDHAPVEPGGRAPFEPLPPPEGGAPPSSHPELGCYRYRFEYRGADGAHQGYVCRFATPAGKTFRPLRHGRLGGRTDWHWTGWGDGRPLYGLLKLLAAPASALVLVVEGEAKTHAAERLLAPGGVTFPPPNPTLVAVSPMQGAYSAHLTDWSAVKGRDVVIWPDHDAAGQAFARTVAELAWAAGAASVRIVTVPPGAPESWDLADLLPTGWTRATIEEAIRTAVAVEPEATTEAPETGAASGDAGENHDAEAAEPSATDAPGGGEPRVSARDRLLKVAAAAAVWRTPDGEAHASMVVNAHREHWPVRSRGFKDWLLRAYGAAYPITIDGQVQPGAVGKQALADALDFIEARALAPAVPVHEPALRSVLHDGAVYLDLGTDDWKVIKVTAEGWSVEDRAPVPLLRTRRTHPLPMPQAGGDIQKLRDFVPVDAATLPLVVAWLLAAIWPGALFPILVIVAEHGSGKSTVTRVLRRLVDPAGGDLLQPPGTERDLVAAARHNRVLAFDNLSNLTPELADALCRLATGAEIGGRGLFTDHDLATFSAARPIILNGIADVATRGDLASRSVTIALDPLKDRKDEAAFWAGFAAAAPLILGALLDGLVAALRNLPGTPTPQGHRMADFAKLAAAAAPAFGWQAAAVTARLAANAQHRAAVLERYAG